MERAVVGLGSRFQHDRKGLAAAFNPKFFWVCLSAPSFPCKCAFFLSPNCRIVHFIRFRDLRSLVCHCLESLFFVGYGRNAFRLHLPLAHKAYVLSFRFLLMAGMLRLQHVCFTVIGCKLLPILLPPESFSYHSFNFELRVQAPHRFRCFLDCPHYHASFAQEYWAS